MHFKPLILIVFIFVISEIVAPYPSGNAVPRFEHIGPYGGDVRSLLIDSTQSSTVYLGTSNGKIFKSTDAGKSWKPLYSEIIKSSYVIETIMQHPKEPGHIYAGAWDLYSEGGGLFESRDAGLSWSAIPLSQESPAVRGIAICRTKPSYMIVGTLSGAFVSADNGQTWIKAGGNELQKVESVSIDPEDPESLYVGTWRLSYTSKDFGKTWMRVEKGMALDSDVFSIPVNPHNPSIIYASACSGVYRSDNRAQSWTRLKVVPGRFEIRALVIYPDPVSAEKIYTGTTEGLFVSNDQGQSWTRLTPDNITIHTIQVDPANNHRILVGTEYQGILLSEDDGKTWNESNYGFIHRQISWILPDSLKSGNFLAGAHSGSGGWYEYEQNTSRWTWSQIEPGMRALSFLILPHNAGKLVGTPQGIYWQNGSASAWVKLQGSISKRIIYGLALDSDHPIVYAGTDQGIYRASLDSMKFQIPSGNRFRPKAWCITAPRNSGENIYAGTSLGLMRSWDRGVTWKIISASGMPDRVVIDAVAVSPSNKEHLFAGTSAGLFETMDGGVCWRRADGGKIGESISSVIFLDSSGNYILAANKTSGGVYYSRDGGNAWQNIMASEFESPAYCIASNPNNPFHVYIGTQWDGIYSLFLR